MSRARSRAIVACLVLALLATPFLFWQPDVPKIIDSVRARATDAVQAVQVLAMTETPSPIDTLVSTSSPTVTATPSATPTATLTPVPPTPTPRPQGMGRNNPFSPGELVSAPHWDIQVLDTMRGPQAWQAIRAANQFNDPAPEGREYLLVKLSALCNYDDGDAHALGGGDFDLTGDQLVRYASASVVEPAPQLDAELFPGGETEGWVAFDIGQDEANLILILDELANHDAESERYLALTEDASLPVPPSLAEIEPDFESSSRAEPVPLGETVTTESWQIAVLEVVRGKDAWAMVQDVNQSNDEPDPGMEYVAIKTYARSIGTADESVRIDEFFFNVTGSANILHAVPPVVDPKPSLSAYLYPGGAHEGWMVQQCQVDESDLVLVFEPTWGSEGERRYLALVP